MEKTLQIAAWLALLTVFPLLWRARRSLRGTTLMPAWRWSAAGLAAWVVVTGVMVVPGNLAAGTADLLGYGVSVVLLCPPIAVLGARRPGVRVWTWFVLLPLCLVLGWTAIASWSAARQAELVLEAPVLLGYMVVAVMGVGNYVGTRFSLSALLYGTALILMLVPVANLELPVPWLEDACRPVAALLFTAAAWLATRKRRTTETEIPLDRLWMEFRDLFGIVWSNRMRERLNDMLTGSDVAAQMEVDGLKFESEGSSPEETLRNAESSIRWLLRRFVDEDSIDRQLSRSQETQVVRRQF